jgi:hypothetical protein
VVCLSANKQEPRPLVKPMPSDKSTLVAATPGPWEAVRVTEGHFLIFPVERSHDRVPIAVCDHSRDGHEPMRIVTTPADAALIASAPDLLQENERLREQLATARVAFLEFLCAVWADRGKLQALKNLELALAESALPQPPTEQK